jgi:hypothetical protein
MGLEGTLPIDWLIPTERYSRECGYLQAKLPGGNIKKLPLISHKAAANRTDAVKVLPPRATSTLGWRLCCLSPENGAEPEDVVSSPLTGPLSLVGSLSLILPLSEEIPWPYNRPFPFHRLVLGSTQRNFPFGAGVVVISSDGVGNLKVAVDCAIEAGCIADTGKLLCWGFADRTNEGHSYAKLKAAHAICLWLFGLRAKQGMLPLLAHEVRPCLVCCEALLEVGQGQAASSL